MAGGKAVGLGNRMLSEGVVDGDGDSVGDTWGEGFGTSASCFAGTSDPDRSSTKEAFDSIGDDFMSELL